MKKIIVFFMLILMCFIAVGCNTQSISFNEKLKAAAEYSFKLEYIDTDKGSVPIFIHCYKQDGAYAYRFSKDGYDNPALSYRQLFINNKFYEVEELQTLGVWGGRYKITDDVAATDERNFIYKYTELVLIGSYLTALKNGEEVTFENKVCTEYAFTLEGIQYNYTFDKDTDLLVKFVMTEGEHVKTLIYRDYVFSDIDAECFEIPGGLTYIETDNLVYEYVIN